MSKIDDNLSEILNIEPVKKQEVAPVEIQPQNDTQTDYDLSRQTIRNLVRKGEEALDELLFVAKQSESPRAYEVVAGMIKNISDGKIYLISQNKKRHITTPDVFNKYGLSRSHILEVGESEIGMHELGEDL